MDEEAILLPEIDILNQDNKGKYLPDNASELSAKKESKIIILKFVIGMIISILRERWIVSTAALIFLLIIIWQFGVLFFLIVFICEFLVLLYQLSDRLVYFPYFPPDSREVVRLPCTIGLPSENLYLYAKDGTKLHAVFVKQDQHTFKNVPTLIYLHGNAGNLGHRLGNIYDLYRLLGINILAVEYRGYGLSHGIPSEAGLCLDAQAAICYLRTRNDIDIDKIILFGRSLGGAVAIDCVSRSEIRSRVACLIVENSFTSIPDMAKVIFSGFKILPSLPVWCHKNKFISKVKMCRVMVPTLLLSGQSDGLVPPHMMVQLYHSCSSPMKKLLQFSGGSHNETWRCRGYYQVFGAFLDEVFHQKAPTSPLPPGITCITEHQVL